MTRIIQYHSSILPKDAIGGSIFALHNYLQSSGFESIVTCADNNISALSSTIRPVSSVLVSTKEFQGLAHEDVLVVHFSFCDPVVDELCKSSARKILVYHNITPSECFRRVGMLGLAEACDAGRAQLGVLSSKFDQAVGVSNYNSSELELQGFKDVRTIPIFVDFDGFDNAKDDDLVAYGLARKAEVNVLFIGRFVPNKRIETIIETISIFKRAFKDISICLHLVGKVWDEGYFGTLMSMAGELGVASSIRLYIGAEQEEVRALFSIADAFLCMSEHEGFMVPIVEAFASNCPVVAVDAAAVGETMGGAGLLMAEADAELAAGLIFMLSTEGEFRRAVITQQAARAAHFRPERTWRCWHEILFGADR